MTQERELLRGTVGAVLFYNAENGYTVLKMQCEDGELVTVVGMIPMAVVGERLLVTGHWVSHSTYGRQFEAEFLERLMPESKKEIAAYLASGTIKGVGAKTAQKIVAQFGTEALDVLENDPQRLTEISGITPRKAREISESFCRQAGIRRLVEYLCVNGLPAELAVRGLSDVWARVPADFAGGPLCAGPAGDWREFWRGRCVCNALRCGGRRCAPAGSWDNF